MKHLPFLCLIVPLSALPSESKAAFLRLLDSHKVLELPISREEPTRIAVEGDRIQTVFGSGETHTLEADEDQGQIFIRPSHTDSVVLTLTTEKGFTQDLRLIPQEKPSEPLILMQPLPHGVPARRKEFLLSREEVEKLLIACQGNRIPIGYKEIPIPLGISRTPYPLIREIKSNQLRGLTFQVKGRESLSAEIFSKTCGLSPTEIVAIFIPTEPSTKGYVYVVAKIRP